MKFRDGLKWALHLIQASPLTVPSYYILDLYYALRSKTLGRPCFSPEERRDVEENLTFIYKSFNRQRMAKRLLRSIRSYYPEARVVIADDSEVPLEADGAEIIHLPFNSGLGRGLVEALARVETPYVMRLDDDMLLTPRSRVHEHLAFLRRHPEVDLCGLQVGGILQSGADVYRAVRMNKALPIPAGTVIEGREVAYKTANCFIARTDSVRKVGWDSNIRMIDHHEFFSRAAGQIVCVQDPGSYVYHCQNWFDWRYRPYRNDTEGDAAYIRAKHDGDRPSDVSEIAVPVASESNAGAGAVGDVVYLVSCAVDEIAPDTRRVAAMDLDAVYSEARRHMLASACGSALKAAGVSHVGFSEARGKAIRKVSIMDIERGRLFSILDALGIWYAPLKGCVLQGLYPSYGMREMSDNDILFDASRAEEVRATLESMGFATVGFGSENVDVYHKEPVCNFEMHRELFSVSNEHEFHRRFHEYYRDVSRLLLPDGNGTAGRHFSDEDFYVYMVAHEYMHFAVSGTGLRSLLDAYVFLRAKSGVLDWDYIESEVGKLGIAEFELRNRRLSTRLFGGEALEDEDEEMLAYVAESGTYGTVSHRVSNGMGRGGRLGYVLRRAFPPGDVMAYKYPVLGKAPVLLSAMWVFHIAKSLRRRRGAVLGELGEALSTRPKWGTCNLARRFLR